MILKKIYQAELREVLLEKVKDTESKVDDYIVGMLDVILLTKD